jgi:hypothetical protein
MNISLVDAESRFEVLCRSYVCAAFDVINLQVQSDDGIRALPLLWAAGILSDHMPHFLGAWHVQEPREACWRAVASDLQDRGVQRLRVAIGPDPVEMKAAMALSFRHNTALPVSVTLADADIDPTLSGHLQYIKIALDVTTSLSRRLKRAATRHGPFTNAASAAAVLRQSAERCIFRDWPEPYEPARALRSPSAAAPTATVG